MNCFQEEVKEKILIVLNNEFRPMGLTKVLNKDFKELKKRLDKTLMMLLYLLAYQNT
jgi:hypothetical protein